MAARTAAPAAPVAAPSTPEPPPSPVLAWPSEWPVPVLPEQATRTRNRGGRGLPMAPVLGAAGNATTLVATAAFEAGGVVGVAATGVVAAAGATAAVVRRRKTVRRNMAARTGGGSGGLQRRPGGARSGWGSLGSPSGGGRPGAGRSGGGTGSASGPARRPGGSPLGSPGGASRPPGAKRPGGDRHPLGDTTAPSRKEKRNKKKHGGKGNKGAGLKAAALRTARAAADPGSKPRKTLAALRSGAVTATKKSLGPKSPTVRAVKAMGRGAKKAWAADRSTSARKSAAARAKRLRGATADGLRSILSAAWTGLKKRDRKAALARLRETWARHRKDRAEKDKPDATPPAVTTTVRRPKTLTAPATTPGAITMPGHHFVAPAMEAARIAASYEPTGMLQVGADFAGLEEALRLYAEAMKITVENADAKQPLAPQIIEIMRQIHGLQLKAADLATELPVAFESLHQVDLDRLRNPRKGAAGERMWDVTTNLGNH